MLVLPIKLFSWIQILYFLSQSIINIGAAIGGVSTSAIAVKFGRKGTIMFAGLPYAIGWLLVLLPAYLHTLDGVSNSLLVSLLLVGRALSGAGLGIASGIISVSESKSFISDDPPLVVCTLGA